MAFVLAISFDFARTGYFKTFLCTAVRFHFWHNNYSFFIVIQFDLAGAKIIRMFLPSNDGRFSITASLPTNE